jgi:hypothetical protein
MEIANISGTGIELRLRRSVYAFGATLALAVLLRGIGASAWAYAALIVPFLGVFFLVYQGLFKTCTFMASRGERDLGDGHEKVANAAEADTLRKRARGVHAATIATAVLATAGIILAAKV